MKTTLLLILLMQLASCTTSERRAAGKAVVAIGTHVLVNAFDTWVEEEFATLQNNEN